MEDPVCMWVSPSHKLGSQTKIKEENERSNECISLLANYKYNVSSGLLILPLLCLPFQDGLYAQITSKNKSFHPRVVLLQQWESNRYDILIKLHTKCNKWPQETLWHEFYFKTYHLNSHDAIILLLVSISWMLIYKDNGNKMKRCHSSYLFVWSFWKKILS